MGGWGERGAELEQREQKWGDGKNEKRKNHKKGEMEKRSTHTDPHTYTHLYTHMAKEPKEEGGAQIKSAPNQVDF